MAPHASAAGQVADVHHVGQRARQRADGRAEVDARAEHGGGGAVAQVAGCRYGVGIGIVERASGAVANDAADVSWRVQWVVDVLVGVFREG